MERHIVAAGRAITRVQREKTGVPAGVFGACDDQSTVDFTPHLNYQLSSPMHSLAFPKTGLD